MVMQYFGQIVRELSGIHDIKVLTSADGRMSAEDRSWWYSGWKPETVTVKFEGDIYKLRWRTW